MKTNVLGMVGKGVCIGVLATFLVSCGEKVGKVSPNSDEKCTKLTQDFSEPGWVNCPESQKKVTDYSPAIAVAGADVLSNNIEYATNQASLQARNRIAQNINSAIESAIKSLESSDGAKIDHASVQAMQSKVNISLQNTKIITKWIDRSSNPNKLYVIVSMDKDAFEKALNGGLAELKIDQDGIRKLNATINETLEKESAR